MLSRFQRAAITPLKVLYDNRLAGFQYTCISVRDQGRIQDFRFGGGVVELKANLSRQETFLGSRFCEKKKQYFVHNSFHPN